MQHPPLVQSGHKSLRPKSAGVATKPGSPSGRALPCRHPAPHGTPCSEGNRPAAPQQAPCHPATSRPRWLSRLIGEIPNEAPVTSILLSASDKTPRGSTLGLVGPPEPPGTALPRLLGGSWQVPRPEIPALVGLGRVSAWRNGSTEPGSTAFPLASCSAAARRQHVEAPRLPILILVLVPTASLPKTPSPRPWPSNCVAALVFQCAVVTAGDGRGSAAGGDPPCLQAERRQHPSSCLPAANGSACC